MSAIAPRRRQLVVDFFSMSLVERSRALADEIMRLGLMGNVDPRRSDSRGVRSHKGQRRRPSRVVVKLKRERKTNGKHRTVYAQPLDYGCSTVSVTKQLPTETRT